MTHEIKRSFFESMIYWDSTIWFVIGLTTIILILNLIVKFRFKKLFFAPLVISVIYGIYKLVVLYIEFQKFR